MEDLLLLAKFVRENLGHYNLSPLIKISSSKFTHQLVLGTCFLLRLPFPMWPLQKNGSSKVPLPKESFYFSIVFLLSPKFESVALHIRGQNLIVVADIVIHETSFECISSTLKHGRHCEHWLMMEEVLVCRLSLQFSQGSQIVQCIKDSASLSCQTSLLSLLMQS